MGIAEIIIIFLMLLFNSLFAAYELALASLSLGQIKILKEQNKRGSKSAYTMKQRMEASLAVIQIGITLAAAIAAATGGAGATESIAPFLRNFFNTTKTFSEVMAIAFIVIPLTSITIIFGELVPKTIALKNSERVCLFLSPAVKYFAYLILPSVLFFEWTTKKIVNIFETRIKKNDDATDENLGLIELRAQASALRTSRIIDSEQEKIILGASRLSRLFVADILIPAYEIVTLFVDEKLPDHFVTIHLDPYTRFPVVEKKSDPQTIIGYVNIKELIYLAKTHPQNPNIREILRPIISFRENTRIGKAFSIMMKEHVHLSIVRDNKGTILGMITLEDILEEVVGDIQDEFDRLPKHISPLGNKFVVGGGVLLTTLFESLNAKEYFKNGVPDLTLNEWVKNNYKKKLKGGDIVNINGIAILLRKIRHNHIHEAIVSFSQHDPRVGD